MLAPEVRVERDTAMRGWEITIFREDGEPVAVAFMGDSGTLQLTAVKQGVAYGVSPEDLPLEPGRTYAWPVEVAT